jgi:hypothetical protein
MAQPTDDPSCEYPDRRDEPRNPPYVVVRFTRAVEPYDDGEQFEEKRLAGWKELGEIWQQVTREFPGVRHRPLFRSLASDELKKFLADTPPPYSGEHPVNFLAYFQVVGMPETHYPLLAQRLREYAHVVETAYDQEIGLPPAANLNQFYLKPAPKTGGWFGGIDAGFAWMRPGGRGDQIRIIDLERGWFLGHADFPASKPVVLNQPPNLTVRPSALHGTQVLGILCAQDGGAADTNGVGIAPNARVDCVSYVETIKPNCDPDVANIEAAILFATTRLGKGDVLLIEATVAESALNPALPLPGPATQRMFLPVEAHDACRDAIAKATAKGIAVIEAGGNGKAAADGSTPGTAPLDMDQWTHPITGKKLLDRTSPHYRECGGIVVSAAALRSNGSPYRLAYAPRGNRVDCFGQGQAAYTTTCDAPASPQGCTTGGYQPTYSLPALSGTSAAAAVIAGAVALIQGIARRRPAGPFPPVYIRDTIFKDAPPVNTQVLSQLNGAALVRYMPDLAKIIPKYLP